MNNLNTARASNIKHNSPEVKDVCYFAERVRTMLEVKKKHLRAAMWVMIRVIVLIIVEQIKFVRYILSILSLWIKYRSIGYFILKLYYKIVKSNE
jgi:hypothetical protein